MKTLNNGYPHPVLYLGSKDYQEDCSFSVTLTDSVEQGNDFVFTLTYDLHCNGLQNIIDNALATIIIKASCSATSFRDSATFKNTEMHLSISRHAITKRIELQGFIVANNDIAGFTLPEHNDVFFKDMPFTLRKGDILAYSQPIVIYIDDSDLEKQLSSIVQIDKVENLDKLYVDFSGQIDGAIHIQMPSDDFSSYSKLRTTYSRYGMSRFLQSAIIIPTITEAIDLLRMEALKASYGDDDETYTDTPWAECIFRKCESLNIDIFDEKISSYSLANELFGMVTKHTIDDLSTRAESMYNNRDSSRLGGVD